MAWGGIGWRVTVAVAVPPGPVAVIFTLELAGITAGAE